MNKSVIILGASGHGKVVADIIMSCGDKVIGFLDDNIQTDEYIGFPVLGETADYVRYLDKEFVIAIGNAAVRKRLAGEMKDAKWYTAVHPRAIVSTLDTCIEPGTVIMANAVVNPGTHIGKHCIINTGATVDHDGRIADFVHISVGARLAGTVSVAQRSWIGIGAVVSNNVSIGEDCVVGAGAVVVKDIEEAGTYVGAPAKKIK